MKRITPLLIFIIILLVSISASASIFDGITGKAIEETEIINEEVKCVFKDTKLEQGCYSGDDRQFSCSGMDSCTANVSGEKGQKLKWKSICEDREITTKIDGIHEVVEFKCEEKYDFLRSTPMQLMLFKEQVKCVFADSDSEQKCYSDDSKFSCSGTGSCAIDIAAPGHGMRIIWKSTCGGFVYTNLNETDKIIEFNCQGIKEPYVYEIVDEDIRCIFTDSTSNKMCYPDGGKFSCSGTEECTVRVSEEKGKMIRWQSSCDRYDYLLEPVHYTVIDGNNEDIQFKCRAPATIILNSGKLPIYFFYKEKCSDCKKTEKVLLQLKEKFPQIEIRYYDVAIPENAEFFSKMAARRGSCGPSFLPIVYFGPGWSACGPLKMDFPGIENLLQECIEHGCVEAYPPKNTRFYEMNYENYMKEYVWCLFKDSELVQRCSKKFDIPGCSNIVRECYTDNNEFGCKWEGGIVASEDGRKYAFCIAETASPSNVTCTNTTNRNNNLTETFCREVVASPPTTLTWKSSCGGYATSVIDGFLDYAEFECAQSETPEDISGKGFLHAYWECYDGTEQKSAEGAGVCKTAEEWKMEAKEFCRSKCHKTSSFLCGINQFSVAGECYAEPKEEPAAAPIEQEEKEKEEELKKEKPEEPKKPEEKEEFLFCRDSCPSEGKCYDFGYRKEGKFCSDEGLFVEQLMDDAACENNFECSTNVCVDGRCISSGLIQKVIDWIRSLFG